MVDHQQINACREILASDQSTNFETRMVAEINLYWIIYESCSMSQVDLPGTQAALHEWKQEWKFLFGTPIFRVDGHFLTYSQINQDPNSFSWDFISHNYLFTIEH